jgi:hypothetical protein
MKKLLLTMALLTIIIAPVSALSCGNQGNQYRTNTGPVSMDEAKQISAYYLSTIDSQLSADDLWLEGQVYLVSVTDENSNQVAKLSIDMLTGDIRPVF